MTVKRPMLWLSVSIVAGMYLLAVFGAAVSFTVIFCAAVTVLIMLCKIRRLFANLILVFSFLLLCTGVLLFGIANDVTVRPLYSYCGEQLFVTGEILDEPIVSDSYVRFNMKATAFSKDGYIFDEVDEKLSAICFINDGACKAVPKRGDVTMVQCEISLPDGAMNTGGFDYAKYLKSKGFYFQAEIEAETMNITGHGERTVSDAVYAFRKHCGSLFDTVFPEKEGSVLKAYVLGDKSTVSSETSDLFSDSGLSHVLAVSGMHVAVFLSCILALLKFFNASKRRQLIVCACSVIFFVIFTGASVATLRAGFVCLAAVSAKLFFRHSDSKTALAEAAAILCAVNPLIVFDASFLLSFSSALGILFFADGISNALSFVYAKLDPSSKAHAVIKAICDITAVGISANLLIIPVMIYLFREFSVMSVIATVVINPVLAPMLVGGLLFTAVGLLSQTIAYPIAGFLYMCAKFMIKTAEFFAWLPFSKLVFGGITPFFLLLYAAAVLAIYFKSVKYSNIGYFVSLYSAVMLSAVFLVFYLSVYNSAEVSFINVGQGDCSLIKAPGNCDILIDAGGKKNNTSVGEKVVKPYLVQNGVYDLEYVIASHGHEDHVNGIISLLEVINIKHIIVPKGFGTTTEGKALLEKAKEKNVPVTYFKHGDVLQINHRMKLTAIVPDDKLLAFLNVDNENDRSLLLKLEYGDVSFLYTGDLSQTGEAYAAALYPELLSADVLKIGHHGSDTSNSEAFFDAVQPKYAFIPVGKNTYGQPRQEILQRLESRNIKFYRADQHRDVTFYFDEQSIKGIRFDDTVLAGETYELR